MKKSSLAPNSTGDVRISIIINATIHKGLRNASYPFYLTFPIAAATLCRIDRFAFDRMIAHPMMDVYLVKY